MNAQSIMQSLRKSLYDMLTSRQKSGRSVRTVSLTAKGHRFSFRSSASTPLSSNVHFEMSLPTSSVKEELLKKIRRRAEE